jgi:hypothetical protein
MRQSSQGRLEALEAQYREQLLVALVRCANGEWGLFGQNDRAIAQMSPHARAHLRQTPIQELLALGTEIEGLRRKLGILEPFDLHDHLMLLRSTADANSLGEPKLAQQWLNDMGSKGDSADVQKS